MNAGYSYIEKNGINILIADVNITAANITIGLIYTIKTPIKRKKSEKIGYNLEPNITSEKIKGYFNIINSVKMFENFRYEHEKFSV